MNHEDIAKVSSRPARLKKIVLGTLVGTCLAMLLIELVALLHVVDFRSILLPPTSVEWLAYNNYRNRVDPELIHIHPPHDYIEGVRYGDLASRLGKAATVRYSYDVRYDHHGFRNEKDYVTAPVVVIGDSLVEGWLVSINDRFSNQLSRAIGLEVCALGQNGYGPQQQLAVLRRYAIPLQPSLLIWIFFEGNDFRDAQRYQKTVKDWTNIRRYNDGFLRRSFTRNALHLLKYKMARHVNNETTFAKHRRGLFQNNGIEENVYFGYQPQPLTSNEEKQLSLTLSIWEQARQQCEDINAHLLIVFAPTKFRVYQDYCQFPGGSECSQWRLNNLPDRIAQWTKEKGIDFINLTTSLKSELAVGHATYYPDDTHWNQTGHTIVATSLSHSIQNWLEDHRWE